MRSWILEAGWCDGRSAQLGLAPPSGPRRGHDRAPCCITQEFCTASGGRRHQRLNAVQKSGAKAPKAIPGNPTPLRNRNVRFTSTPAVRFAQIAAVPRRRAHWFNLTPSAFTTVQKSRPCNIPSPQDRSRKFALRVAHSRLRKGAYLTGNVDEALSQLRSGSRTPEQMQLYGESEARYLDKVHPTGGDTSN